MTELETIQNRKSDHLKICKTRDVQSIGRAGWDDIRLPHKALPEVDFAEVTTETKFIGHSFSAPLLISSMTGGNPEGEVTNILLAQFAEEKNIPMGVGSQRVALENRQAGYFQLRKFAPRAKLFANIGLVQMNYGVSADDLAWLVDQLEAQALILHLNPLQEAIQQEGDRNFSKLLERIPEIRKKINCPIILKETGCGLDVASARRALELGVDALDVAGLGGTHWGFIEGLRDENRRPLGEIFRDWGTPTVQSLIDIRNALGFSTPLIASGGIRSGLDMARALYLGADFCGMALPFLKAAQGGEKSLESFYQLQVEALKIALFCTGVQSTEELKSL